MEAADRLALALRRAQSGHVRFDPAGRHLYASDASHYRQVPIGVVVPRTIDDLIATVSVCRDHAAPITMRGAGTSLAGQACNVAVVVDTSQHLDRIVHVDPDARRAVVEPGVVLASLQRAAAQHGLMVGPDPATANRCTIGGMIGNNACGAHTLRTGRTSDNVHRLDVLLTDGTRLVAGPLPDKATDEHHAVATARAVAIEQADRIRSRYPSIPRRVSGYNLDDLLPGRGHLGRFLTGTEGTLAVVLEAELALVPRPAARALLVVAHHDAVAAAAHAPTLVTTGAIALEGMDAAVVSGARGRNVAAAARLAPAGAWLLAEYGADTPAAARAAAEAAAAVAAPDAVEVDVVSDAALQAALWEVRRAGLGAVTFQPGLPAHVGGWEDAAVDPARLADYLAAFTTLCADHGLPMALYGHFGDGCVHTKIGFDHATVDGIARYRRFVEEAADLTVAHGGVPSGEHGDGQARGELLTRVFGSELVEAHRRIKDAFDPAGLLNPGKLVDARPLDADLRNAGTRVGALQAGRPDAAASLPPGPAATGHPALAWPDDHDDLAVAAGRCVGMGVCRRDDDVATMCPSFRATRDETHSTRGRARLLQEALRPGSDLGGWASSEAAEALDLCLSCKACASDCPTGVDVAALKTEFNARHFGRGGARRPAAHWTLGLVPWWLAVGSATPRLANVALRSPLARPLRRLAGVTDARPAPTLAPTTLRGWWRRHRDRAGPNRPSRPNAPTPILLFADTFTDRLAPGVGRDAVTVLEAAGFAVHVPDQWACCGRPLLDPGMVGLARRWATRTVTLLDAALQATGASQVVVLEPSCAAMLVDEVPRLLTADQELRAAARRVAAAVRTLSGALAEAGWTPPRVAGTVLVEGHCHQHATVGFSGEAAVLDAAGSDWSLADDGCCGLAGAFGYEAGTKAALSVTIGESRVLRTVRSLPDEAIVVADGWSCRTQVEHLQDRFRPVHTATLLAEALGLRSAPALRSAPQREPGRRVRRPTSRRRSASS